MQRVEALKYLDLKEGFTLSELKKKYRLFVLRNHPDVSQSNDDTLFNRGTEAYTLLLKDKPVSEVNVFTHISIFSVASKIV